MQQQARYQRGSLRLEKRRSQPNVWTFRHYVDGPEGRVYKKQVVGTVLTYPKRKDAEKAVTHLRVNINEGAAFTPRTIAELVAHYREREFPSLAFSTTEAHSSYLNAYVLPKYGTRQVSGLTSVEVEDWLRGLKKRDGKPAAPGTATKLRNLMSSLFSHAIRHGWAATNPITAVRTSAKRLRVPDILSGG